LAFLGIPITAVLAWLFQNRLRNAQQEREDKLRADQLDREDDLRREQQEREDRLRREEHRREDRFRYSQLRIPAYAEFAQAANELVINAPAYVRDGKLDERNGLQRGFF